MAACIVSSSLAARLPRTAVSALAGGLACALVASQAAAASPGPATPAAGATIASGLRSVPTADVGGLRLSRESTPLGLPGAARLDAVWPLPGGRDELRAQLAVPGAVDGGDAVFRAAAMAGAGNAAASWRGEPSRFTWRRAWIDTPELKLRLGVTARGRDAGLPLVQGPTLAGRLEGGFVPLLHASIEHRLGDRFSLLADVDALGTGGRATVDAGLRLRYEFSPSIAGTMWYRMLDAAPSGRDAVDLPRQQSLSLGLQYRW